MEITPCCKEFRFYCFHCLALGGGGDGVAASWDNREYRSWPHPLDSEEQLGSPSQPFFFIAQSRGWTDGQSDGCYQERNTPFLRNTTGGG